MKKSLLFLFVGALLVACGASKNKPVSTYEVTLAFTITSDYCNGVPPRDKVIKELQTPSSYSNKDIMLSSTNSLTDTMETLSTDNEGRITTSLEASTYYVFLPGKRYASLMVGGNEASCNRWKNTPDGTFDVDSGNKLVEINLHKTCNPCGAARK